MAAFGRLSSRQNLTRLRRVPAAARRLRGCAARCGAISPRSRRGCVDANASTLPGALTAYAVIRLRASVRRLTSNHPSNHPYTLQLYIYRC